MSSQRMHKLLRNLSEVGHGLVRLGRLCSTRLSVINDRACDVVIEIERSLDLRTWLSHKEAV
jgi:hypothetical protein